MDDNKRAGTSPTEHVFTHNKQHLLLDVAFYYMYVEWYMDNSSHYALGQMM